MSTSDRVLSLLFSMEGIRAIDAHGLSAAPQMRSEIVEAATKEGGEWRQGTFFGSMHCRFSDGSQISMFDKDLGPSRMLVFSVVPL